MFTGIIMPILTPFTETGEVDEDALLTLADGLIDAGVHNLFVMGSAGQGPVMELDERRRTAEILIKHVAGRVPLIIHIGTPYLKTTVELARHAHQAGADGLAAVPPYYYSDHPEAEVDAHLIGAAAATPLPFVVYNNERYTGINITAPWLKRLAGEIPNLAGIKLSFVSQGVIFSYLEMVPDRVAIYTANILEVLPTAPFGVKGCIHPPSILFPELAVAIWDAVQAKDYTRAFELQGRVKKASAGLGRLERTHGRFVTGEGLRIRGYDVKCYPRWAEGTPLDDDARAEIRALLEAATPEEATSRVALA